MTPVTYSTSSFVTWGIDFRLSPSFPVKPVLQNYIMHQKRSELNIFMDKNVNTFFFKILHSHINEPFNVLWVLLNM